MRPLVTYYDVTTGWILYSGHICDRSHPINTPQLYNYKFESATQEINPKPENINRSRYPRLPASASCLTTRVSKGRQLGSDLSHVSISALAVQIFDLYQPTVGNIYLCDQWLCTVVPCVTGHVCDRSRMWPLNISKLLWHLTKITDIWITMQPIQWSHIMWPLHWSHIKWPLVTHVTSHIYYERLNNNMTAIYSISGRTCDYCTGWI